MDLIQHTTEWGQGEVQQGKIMVVLGVSFALAGLFIWKSNHELLGGTLIPLVLIIVLLIGYGGYPVVSRPGHVQTVKERLMLDVNDATQQKVSKAQIDDKAYALLKRIWPVLLILSTLIYFMVSADFYKGMSIGWMLLFLTGISVDSLLHYGLQRYMDALVTFT